MKKIAVLSLLTLTSLFAVSCGKKDNSNNSNGGNSDTNNDNTEIKKYKITFNSNDPNTEDNYVPTIIDDLEVKEGNSLDLTSYTPTMTGYFFAGWATNQKGSRKVGDSYTPTADTTLYAVWEKGIVVTINPQNGKESSLLTVHSGDKIDKPASTTKANKTIKGVDIYSYTFDDWYSDEGLTKTFDFTKEITKDTTIYAKYKSSPLSNYVYTTSDNFSKDGTLLSDASDELLKNLSVTSGFAKGGVTDFSKYKGTDMYVEVESAEDLAKAIYNAKYSYTNTWENGSLNQSLEKEGAVHVIEIKNDLDLAYTKLSTDAKSNGVLEDWDRKKSASTLKSSGYSMTDIALGGITKIKLENISNLLIYSKNGSKITHAGFSILSCQNLAIRNLEMDEIWQWEDSSKQSLSGIGDYDLFGWAYAKISFSTGVWIDHCKFGKSYDGQIDVSNGSYETNVASGEYFRAPYEGDNRTGVSITFSEFNSSSNEFYKDSEDAKNTYLYKMMASIELEYQEGKNNYLYYNALRKYGFTFDQILKGIAAAQKKGFLLGDNDQINNYYLKISFNFCKFNNIEDRLFKVRGCIVTSSNSIFDSQNYYNARKDFYSGTTNLAKKAVNDTTLGGSSGFKAAMVSQAILISQGGSFCGNNNYYLGIVKKQLIRNNDNDSTKGGIKLDNTKYYDIESSTWLNVEDDDFTDFSDASSLISNTNFSYNEFLNTPPFKITPIGGYEDILGIMNNTKYGLGISNELQELLLTSSYLNE